MPAQPVRTFEEWAEIAARGAPRTRDDVTILADGRRIDTPEKARAWVAEVNAQRAREDAAAAQRLADEPAA